MSDKKKDLDEFGLLERHKKEDNEFAHLGPPYTVVQALQDLRETFPEDEYLKSMQKTIDKIVDDTTHDEYKWPKK